MKGGEERVREKEQKHKEFIYNCGKWIIISCVIILYSISLLLNYHANSEFDTLYYLELKNFNIYKGFEFTDEAKNEPILFWRWDCSPTKYDKKYLCCKHNPLIGESKSFIFDLVELTEEEIKYKLEINKVRDQIQSWIFWSVFILIIVCLFFWWYQYKYDYDNWKKTPFAKFMNRLEKL